MFFIRITSLVYGVLQLENIKVTQTFLFEKRMYDKNNYRRNRQKFVANNDVKYKCVRYLSTYFYLGE